MAEPSKAPFVYATVLVLAVLGVYLPGLNNALFFDDFRLTEGTIFGAYGSLLDFKQRMLSYGSFVWVQQIVGEGWWKQRLVNLGLHLAVVASLYALLRALMQHTRFPQEFEAQPHFHASRTAALRIGVALFALNPVAVYAVAYLIQRSIVMATLGAVLACWAFVRGLQTRRAGWYVLAVVCYLLAILSKEHAALTIAMALPLYLYIRTPDRKTAAGLVGVTALALALAAAVFWSTYGHILGRVFDPTSIALTRQLEALRPGITAQMYPLSVLNEAALFFVYGFLWFVPNVLWMSVDLRPAFPLGFASFWHVLGALAFVGLLAGSLWSVLRKRNALGLAGLLLLFPLLWYFTEFATVWVQDPFVLYRSYLWAVAVPGLMAIALTGFKPRTIYVLGAALGLVFGALALERVLSLKDAGTAWGDAAEKIDRQAPANAVGRSRPYLNLGAYHLEKGLLTQAERDFTLAESLGDPQGNARFNLGVTLAMQKKFPEALAAFNQAEAQGYSGGSLHYQRAEAAFALGQFKQAFEQFDAALKAAPEMLNDLSQLPQLQQTLQQRRAEAAIGAMRYDDAIESFRALLAAHPQHPRYTTGLGMALIGKGDTRQALTLFDELIQRAPSAPAFYGRSMARHRAGDTSAALQDLDQAIRLDPRNAQYRQVRDRIAGMQAKKP